MGITKFIKKFIPKGVWRIIHLNRVYLTDYAQYQHKYAEKVKELRVSNRPIRVIFQVQYSAMWKCESIYRKMEQDNLFDPMILVCPVVDKGMCHREETLKNTYAYFKERNYRVVPIPIEASAEGKELSYFKPDIVFYCDPYECALGKCYQLKNNTQYLSCYTGYGYNSVPNSFTFDTPFHRMLWKFFIECYENKKLPQKYSPTLGRNCVVSGYPLYDEFKTKMEQKCINEGKVKRIIWAPHHTIEGDDQFLKFSTFLMIADKMLELAGQYSEDIQIAFKPHPELKWALYKHSKWGKDRTDNYYAQWAKGSNTTLETGEYVNLFVQSDAMIHDCGSFLVEYLYVNKPVMFMTNYNRESQCNEVGKKALRCHYHGKSVEDIEAFIKNVVIGGEDTMKGVRSEFYNNILVPPNGKSVAENIVDCIKKELHK